MLQEYWPGCSCLAATPHADRLAALPVREQYAALELFRGTMQRHSLIAYRYEAPADGGCRSRADHDRRAEFSKFGDARGPGDDSNLFAFDDREGTHGTLAQAACSRLTSTEVKLSGKIILVFCLSPCKWPLESRAWHRYCYEPNVCFFKDFLQ